MSDTLSIRLPVEEKKRWQAVAKAGKAALSEFVRATVNERLAELEKAGQSPWDKHFGSVAVPLAGRPATNANVRRAMKGKHGVSR